MKPVNLSNLLAVVNANLKNIEITSEQMTTNLSEIGVDSVGFIQIIVSLEDEFECEIPDAKLLMTEMGTVEKILIVLQELYDESKK